MIQLIYFVDKELLSLKIKSLLHLPLDFNIFYRPLIDGIMVCLFLELKMKRINCKLWAEFEIS